MFEGIIPNVIVYCCTIFPILIHYASLWYDAKKVHLVVTHNIFHQKCKIFTWTFMIHDLDFFPVKPSLSSRSLEAELLIKEMQVCVAVVVGCSLRQHFEHYHQISTFQLPWAKKLVFLWLYYKCSCPYISRDTRCTALKSRF